MMRTTQSVRDIVAKPVKKKTVAEAGDLVCGIALQQAVMCQLLDSYQADGGDWAAFAKVIASGLTSRWQTAANGPHRALPDPQSIDEQLLAEAVTSVLAAAFASLHQPSHLRRALRRLLQRIPSGMLDHVACPQTTALLLTLTAADVPDHHACADLLYDLADAPLTFAHTAIEAAAPALVLFFVKHIAVLSKRIRLSNVTTSADPNESLLSSLRSLLLLVQRFSRSKSLPVQLDEATRVCIVVLLEPQHTKECSAMAAMILFAHAQLMYTNRPDQAARDYASYLLCPQQRRLPTVDVKPLVWWLGVEVGALAPINEVDYTVQALVLKALMSCHVEACLAQVSPGSVFLLSHILPALLKLNNSPTNRNAYFDRLVIPLFPQIVSIAATTLQQLRIQQPQIQAEYSEGLSELPVESVELAVNLLGSSVRSELWLKSIVQIVTTFWEHPIDTIRDICCELFSRVLALTQEWKDWSKLTNLQFPAIHGGGSFDSAVEAQTFLLDCILNTPWSVKSRYIVLRHILSPSILAQVIQRATLSSDLLRCAGHHPLMAVSGDLYRAIIALQDFGEWQAYWCTKLLGPVLAGTAGPDVQSALFNFWIPPTLTRFVSDAVVVLLETMQDFPLNSRVVLAAIELLGQARRAGILISSIPSESPLLENIHDLLEDNDEDFSSLPLWYRWVKEKRIIPSAFASLDSVTRSAAGMLVAAAAKPSDVLTMLESKIIANFFVHNCNGAGSGAAFRLAVKAVLHKSFMRVLLGTGALVRRHSTGKGGETTAEQVQEVELAGRTLIHSVSEEILLALSPGSPFQRKHTALLCLQSALEVFFTSNAQHAGHAEVCREQLGAVVFMSRRMAVALLTCLDDPFEVVRTTASVLLRGALSDHFTVADLETMLLRAQRLCKSGRMFECATAAQLCLLLQQCSSRIGKSRVSFLQMWLAFVGDFSSLTSGCLVLLHQGPILCLRTCFEALDLSAATVSAMAADEVGRWRDLVQSLLKHCSSVIEAVEQVLTMGEVSDSHTPTFADLVKAAEDLCFDGNSGDDAADDAPAEPSSDAGVILTDQQRRLLTLLWVSVRESGALAASIVQNCALDLPEGYPILQMSDVEKIGTLIANALARARHRGLIEHLAESFERICGRAHRAEGLSHLPSQWIDLALFDEVEKQDQTVSVTRRGAGVPQMLLAAVASVPPGSTYQLLRYCVEKLLALAQQPLPLSTNERMDLVQARAMFAMLYLFRDARLSFPSMEYAGHAVQLAIDKFSSPAFGIRNAAVQLFGAASLRACGTGRMVSKSHAGPVVASTISVQDLFTRFTFLENFFVDILRDGNKTVSQAPVLTMLSLLVPNETPYSVSSELQAAVRAQLRSPSYHIRHLAARALAMILNGRQLEEQLVQSLTILRICKHHNEIHGLLMTVMSIARERGADVAAPLQRFNASFSGRANWLVTADNPCAVTRGTALELGWAIAKLNGRPTEILDVLTNLLTAAQRMIDLSSVDTTDIAVGMSVMREQAVSVSLDILSCMGDEEAEVSWCRSLLHSKQKSIRALATERLEMKSQVADTWKEIVKQEVLATQVDLTVLFSLSAKDQLQLSVDEVHQVIQLLQPPFIHLPTDSVIFVGALLRRAVLLGLDTGDASQPISQLLSRFVGLVTRLGQPSQSVEDRVLAACALRHVAPEVLLSNPALPLWFLLPDLLEDEETEVYLPACTAVSSCAWAEQSKLFAAQLTCDPRTCLRVCFDHLKQHESALPLLCLYILDLFGGKSTETALVSMCVDFQAAERRLFEEEPVNVSSDVKRRAELALDALRHHLSRSAAPENFVSALLRRVDALATVDFEAASQHSDTIGPYANSKRFGFVWVTLATLRLIGTGQDAVKDKLRRKLTAIDFDGLLERLV